MQKTSDDSGVSRLADRISHVRCDVHLVPRKVDSCSRSMDWMECNTRMVYLQRFSEWKTKMEKTVDDMSKKLDAILERLD